MLFNIFMYTFPAVMMILGAFILLYRTILVNVLGESVNKLIFIISIMFFIVGILGFVLVFNALIDFFLIWLLFAIVILGGMAFLFYYLYRNRPKS